jgi:hypothetical protein
MRRAWVILLIILIALIPWASTRPDPIQRLLGLPGGADRIGKALFGIAVTVGLVMGLGWALQKLGRRKNG